MRSNVTVQTGATTVSKFNVSRNACRVSTSGLSTGQVTVALPKPSGMGVSNKAVPWKAAVPAGFMAQQISLRLQLPAVVRICRASELVPQSAVTTSQVAIKLG